MAELAPRYQWTQGEHNFIVEESAQSNEEFIFFRSGRRVKLDKVGTLVMPIYDSSEILLDPSGDADIENRFHIEGDWDKVQAGEMVDPRMAQQAPKQSPITAKKETVQEQPKTEVDPMMKLIESANKNKLEIDYKIDIEIPSNQALELISAAFDAKDLEKKVLKFCMEKFFGNKSTMLKELERQVKKEIQEYYKQD